MNEFLQLTDSTRQSLLDQGNNSNAAQILVQPTSFSQQRLWFLSQLEPELLSYNLAVALRLTGQLNPNALQQSLDELVQRHEILRTTIGVPSDEPVQRVAPRLNLSLQSLDLTSLPAHQREAEARRLANEEIQRPFDLTDGPLARATLIQLDPTDHILLLTLHRIITDDESATLIQQDLTSLYTAFSSGQPSPLLNPLSQYADFARRQQEGLADPMFTKSLAYWRHHLGGNLPVTALPVDRPRPPVHTFHSGSHSFNLSPDLTEALKTLSRQEQVSLFDTLLAAFKTLLYRYTGQEDTLVGTPWRDPKLAQLAGPVANTLVLRSQLSDPLTGRTLLKQIHKTVADAIIHQTVPLEKLIEALQPKRDLSHNPLFQVMFSLQPPPPSAIRLPNLTLTPWPVASGPLLVDLALSLTDTTAGLHGSLLYNLDLFDPATIERMAGHLQTLLAGLVANPDTPIAQLSLLTQAERQQLLDDWNNTQADYPGDACLHQLFEQQVERTPEKIAAIFEADQLTYAELNRRANQVAHHLQRLGVGPDTLVAICLERSLDMLVGLLGILKAGGAYIPLDPAYPQERLAFMLADTQARLLLTQQNLAGRFADSAAQIISLDTTGSAIAQYSHQNPASTVNSGQRAYVIYTSGSTGKPKGVQIPHRAAVNFLTSMRHEPGLNEDDILLSVTTLSFDIALLELFLPLSVGARVVIVGREAAADGQQLQHLLTHSGSTMMQATPTTWRLLLTSGWPGTPHLKILCGGEAMPPDLAQQLLPRCASLWNMYGPTETTVWSTLQRVQNGLISIGRPIANTQVYILDAQLQPVPIGVAGELYIGGDGLALGYLNRPDLTTERFIPNPFIKDEGERMKDENSSLIPHPSSLILYKTGDLARYLPAGNIEYLGRIDHQVKIRGFRIELGEIETALAQHPRLKEVVVVARKTDTAQGDKKLVAYFVPTHLPEPSSADLRAFLRQSLPEFMLPAIFVTLESLPLSPNGKINRRALPEPGSTRPDLAATFVAPRTALEEGLAGLWAEIMGLERVGIYDNFFELGGQSLLAMQVISRLRQLYQVDLPLRSLFEAPTVAGLAEQIEIRQGAEAGPQFVPMRRDGPLPLSFAQQRLWLVDQLEPGNPAYNLPEAVRLRGPLKVAALQASLNQIVQRHEALRTTFAVVAGAPVQVIAPSLTLALPLVDLRSKPAAERETEAQRLAFDEGRQPFDLSRGPLLRATLLWLDEQEYLLLLTMHHIVSDGWSAHVFWGELAVLYEAFILGQPSPLPDLPIQYTDFTLWQRQWLQGELLQKQLAYWQQRLDPLPPALELPTDRPRPAAPTFRGARQSFILPAELTQALKNLSRQADATLFMTLLAAFKTLLYRYTGQTDLTIGVPIANRNQAELEPLIGFLVNMLVFRTDLAGNLTFEALLERVRQVALAAYVHQDLPFDKLVEAVQPERDLSSSPLFQVAFAFNGPAPDIRLDQLTVSPLPIHQGTSMFDLTLFVEETADTLVGAVEYSTDLFDTTTVTRLIGQFQTLLAAIITQPEMPISRLPLLTAAEQQQILLNWNDTATNFPQQRSLQQLFEAQVEANPQATAVIFGSAQLTYAELNQRANQVAHHLRSLGVGPEDLVGLCIERSAEMIVGLLGILKAGGAYVPIDPDYPPERLAYMLTDSQARVLLSQEALLKNLPDTEAKIVCLDRDWPVLAQAPVANPVPVTTADNLAYVMYTSGSTGRPKGVAILQRGINRLVCKTDYIEFRSTDRVAQASNASFDAATFEIWGALLHGACLVGFSREVILSPQQFTTALREANITILLLTTALFNQIATHAPDTFATVQQVLFGGEAVDPHAVRMVRQHGPPRRLLNAYGPTEITTIATCYLVEAEPETATSIPIGRPIANTELYILDRHLQPVPIGVPGELYLGGDGLARGYWRRPELTAERFIPNPFIKDEGGRMKDENSSFILPPSSFILYKTGDLVRYLPDGNLEFLGRVDQQVKLRGFRVELGEIEAILGQHTAVRQAIVIAREDKPGDKRLVAYVVPAPTEPDSPPNLPQALRQFLKETLPDYMIPAAFVVLASFPITPNGKVDQRALPPPEAITQLHDKFSAPQSQIERELAHIWETLLGVQPVGQHDNFFELGGHSLLAVRMFSQIQQSFGVNLPLASLFKAATVAHLARLIEAQGHLTAWPSLVELQPHGHRPPFFCIHGITGDILWFRELALQLAPDQPFYGIQAQGLDGVQPPIETIELMAAQYISEIRAFQPRGPYFLGGASFGGTVALEMSRQLQAQGERVALLAMFDHAPPNMEKRLHPSGGTKMKQVLNLLANFPYWLNSFRQLGPAEMLARLQRKFKVGQKISEAKLNPLEMNIDGFDAADIIDYAAELPLHRQRLIEAHFRAINAYQPPQTPNRVILFRARAQSLFPGADPAAGWQLLAGGGVEVRVIPGSHEGIFKTPQVEILAQQLRVCLDEAQQS